MKNALIERTGTTFVGDLVEQIAVAKFMSQGLYVSKPVTQAPYDLIVEGAKLFKIQCKKARFKEDYVCFNISSMTYSKKDGRQSYDYHGKIDYFYSYCFELDRHFLVPISAVGISEFRIRIGPPKVSYTSMNQESEFLFNKQIVSML